MTAKVVATGEFHGLKTMVVLVQNGSHHCGYVGVPADHPLYEHPYYEPAECLTAMAKRAEEGTVGERSPIMILLMACEDKGIQPRPDMVFDVHGSITFADYITQHWAPYEDEELWWFGYDCAHAGDEIRCEGYPGFPGGVWRDVDFCKEQCEKLAAQLAEVWLDVEAAAEREHS